MILDTLLDICLSNKAPLPDFTGLLWQRQFFLTYPSLSFLHVSAGNVLG